MKWFSMLWKYEMHMNFGFGWTTFSEKVTARLKNPAQRNRGRYEEKTNDILDYTLVSEGDLKMM
jgi:hypothetical protein